MRCWDLLLLAGVGACGFAPTLSRDGGFDGPVRDAPDATVDAAVARITNGVRGFWKFDEGAGTMVMDHATPPPSKPPMNLTISPQGAVAWMPGGLSVNAPAKIVSTSAPNVGQLIDDAGAFTIEVWVTPANDTQGFGAADAGGAIYAAVFAASGSIISHDALIAQVGDHWTARSRTMATDANGAPEIASATGTAHAGAPTHLVLVTNGTERELYVDGIPSMSSPSGVATIDWDPSYALRFGNEDVYDRHWLGILWMAAIYDRALSDAEIKQNLAAGYACTDC